jgi:hypothetical protein
MSSSGCIRLAPRPQPLGSLVLPHSPGIWQEFDRRDRDNIDRIKSLEATVLELNSAVRSAPKQEA